MESPLFMLILCYRSIKKTRFYFLLIHSLRSVCYSWMYIVHTYNLSPWEGAQISGQAGHSSRPSLKNKFIFAMLASILSTWETMGNKTRYSSARLQRHGQCVSSQEKWRKHNRYGKVWRIDKGSSVSHEALLLTSHHTEDLDFMWMG